MRARNVYSPDQPGSVSRTGSSPELRTHSPSTSMRVPWAWGFSVTSATRRPFLSRVVSDQSRAPPRAVFHDRPARTRMTPARIPPSHTQVSDHADEARRLSASEDCRSANLGPHVEIAEETVDHGCKIADYVSYSVVSCAGGSRSGDAVDRRIDPFRHQVGIQRPFGADHLACQRAAGPMALLAVSSRSAAGPPKVVKAYQTCQGAKADYRPPESGSAARCAVSDRVTRSVVIPQHSDRQAKWKARRTSLVAAADLGHPRGQRKNL